MIKLTGSVSRKVPIPEKEYSSQSFSAGMEVEVGNEASSEEVQQKLQEIYEVLEESVKQQILSNGVPVPEKANSGNGPRDGDPITPSQKKLIAKLVREQSIFGRERIRLMNVKTKDEAKLEIKKLLSKAPQRG